MASIESLLNPLPDETSFGVQQALTVTPGPVGSNENENAPSDDTGSRPVEKKPKIAKDAPIFEPASPRGEIRYPPCELRDDTLKQEHKKFHIFPMDEISLYPRHVPYISKKKSFLEKTGRESFEGNGVTYSFCIRHIR
jgi:hypothetical protein